MFIRKKHYKELCQRIANLEQAVKDMPVEFDNKLSGYSEIVEDLQSTVSNIPTEFDEKLCAFAESIGDLQDKVSDLDDGLDRETRDKNRKFDDNFREGLANIMSYGVLNGTKESDS